MRMSVPYLVLEFVAGKNLGDLIAIRKRLDEPTALGIMADVARALLAPHERGIVHRDVKPANILLLESGSIDSLAMAATAEMPGDGGRWTGRRRSPTPEPIEPSFRVKLSDFGLARHVVDTQSLAMTEAGALLGTPHYMAPEQWNGLATDPRTDVYAMGATLFHMLAGRPPFVAETRDELLRQHCSEPVPPLGRFNPAVSDGVDAGGREGDGQAARGPLRRRRGDAPRPRGAPARHADGDRRSTLACPPATRAT